MSRLPPKRWGTRRARGLGPGFRRAPIRAAVTATQGGADQEGEAVALSGKELGDEERRTPRGSGIWSLRKEFEDPVKGEIEGQSQAKEDGELLGRFTNSEPGFKRKQVRKGGLEVETRRRGMKNPKGRFRIHRRMTKDGDLFGGIRKSKTGGEGR